MSAAEASFVDTNLLLYAFGTVHPEKNAIARQWLRGLWATGSGRLSYQVLNEFYANAIRKIGVPVPTARAAVLGWMEWRPVDMSLGLLERAWHWMDAAQLSYWDSLILAAAEISDCRWLLTEDMQHDRTFASVTVVNPFRVSPTDFGLTAPE
jgi:predicted nucleic acid-binding protein